MTTALAAARFLAASSSCSVATIIPRCASSNTFCADLSLHLAAASSCMACRTASCGCCVPLALFLVLRDKACQRSAVTRVDDAALQSVELFQGAGDLPLLLDTGPDGG